jgi:glycerol-3-phosphate dehydrogenase (NAD(P)+)
MKATVIGDGGWGTALAMVLQRNGHAVTVWGPFEEYIETVRREGCNATYLPGVELPPELTWTADREEAVAGADLVVFAVPSKFYRDVARSFKGILGADVPVVSVAKGFDETTHCVMTDVLIEELGTTRMAALSGPSHAEEVARQIPTAVVIASTDEALAEMAQSAFANPRFRVYSSADLLGVQIGGAIKNVIAVAVGVSDGIGFGDNTRAALITRGLAEMIRLGEALGADVATFSGLSGLGDLIVTCTSVLSRNYSTGNRLGKGETIDEILGSMKQVAEGVWNCRQAEHLATTLGIELPICHEVFCLVNEAKPPARAVEDLLTRVLKAE